MTKTETISELREFVANQAFEDAHLSGSERRYQAEIVSDVLTQEAPDAKVLKDLIDDYFGQIALARK